MDIIALLCFATYDMKTAYSDDPKQIKYF